MDNQFKNKIRRLQLENFTCFSKADLEFSPGINVFIGENGTGKTHLLKVLYYTQELGAFNSSRLSTGISEYFGLSDYLELIKEEASFSMIEYEFGGQRILVNFNSTEFRRSSESPPQINIKPIFIPAKEMLSWYKGLTSLYQKRATSFDRTYFDMAVNLGLEVSKNREAIDLAYLMNAVEKEIDATVELGEDQNFYIFFNNKKRKQKAKIVSAGINKLAQLLRLIQNGSITKETILIWDEPSANLNPKFTKVAVDFLIALAKAGCQIFVASHDYLFTQRLSLYAEYREIKPDTPDMKFFSLYKGENGTAIESGATLTDLDHDTILDEHAELNDLESEFYRKTIPAEV